MSTAPRLITLIMLLQNRPNQKAAELAEQLGVSVRTLHRYFEQLDEMGIPVYSERGPYGGFSLVRGYRMPPLVLTPEEAVAVFLGTGLVDELWGQAYRQAARGALAKLENLLPDEQRQEVNWARRTLLATGMHRSDQEALQPALEVLRRASRERRQVCMAYQSRGQELSRRTFDPYGLVHRWGYWYAVGYCHLRQAVRIFRVDRMAEVMLEETTFDVPGGFDLRAYLEQEPQVQPLVQVQACFAAAARPVLKEAPLYGAVSQAQPDGTLLVSFPAPNLEWAAAMLLSYGPLVEVLEPPELRELVGQWARDVAEKYVLTHT